MARRRNGPLNPFGFVELEVNSPYLRAECRIKNAGPGEADTGRTMRRIVALAGNKFDPDSLLAMPEPDKIEPPTKVESIPKSSIGKPSQSRKPFPPDPTNWAFQLGLYLADPKAPSIGSTPSIRSTPSAGSSRVGASTRVAPSASQPSSDLDRPKPIERFDRAVVPPDRSFQVYLGTIFLGKETKETIRATIKSLDEEQIENRVCRWLEVDVVANRENLPENREAARVLVDAVAYNKSGEFKIKRGWIAYGNKESIFAIPSDGNLESLVDLRLPIQHKLDLTRIGVADVLSMLFNADLRPRTTKIGELRADFAGLLSGMSRRGTKMDIEHRSGNRLECYLYKSPLDLATTNYSFFRSTQVPFGFVDVTLKANDIKIGLETENFGRLGSDIETSPLFSNLVPSGPLPLNSVKPATTKPNWRVWTWHHAGKTYKAWAEFGGTIETANGEDVLLRDEAELEIRVPKNLLSELDIAFLDAGRIWLHFGNQRRVLVEDNISTNTLVFRIPGNPPRSTHHMGGLTNRVDLVFLEKLRAAKKLKPDRQKFIQDWQSFAGYIK